MLCIDFPNFKGCQYRNIAEYVYLAHPTYPQYHLMQLDVGCGIYIYPYNEKNLVLYDTFSEKLNLHFLDIKWFCNVLKNWSYMILENFQLSDVAEYRCVEATTQFFCCWKPHILSTQKYRGFNTKNYFQWFYLSTLRKYFTRDVSQNMTAGYTQSTHSMRS